MSTPHITTVQKHLLETLAALRDKDNPMDVDRAKAIAHVAGVLVDTAKVEVEYLKATGQHESAFLRDDSLPALPNGITAITRHRLQG